MSREIKSTPENQNSTFVAPNEGRRSVHDIPLPHEIPPPPDLSQLPNHILHTGTIETLIGQNEDLMSRLKVNIRRNSVLEQQIMEFEKLVNEINKINSSLNSQISLLHEKEKIWKEKSSKVDTQHQTFKAEIEKINSQLKKSEMLASSLRHELTILKNYRRRIQNWVHPRLAQNKDLLAQTQKRLQVRDAEVSDLRARLSEAIVHMQDLEKQFHGDQNRLVEKYEIKQKELEEELAKLKKDLKPMKDKAQRMDEAISLKAEAQNKVVYLERKNRDLHRSYQAERLDLQNQVNKYRQEAKVLAVETLEYDRRLTEVSQDLKDAKEKYAQLQDQIDSQQTLWNDDKKRLEESEKQRQILSQINRELNFQLRDHKTKRQTATGANHVTSTLDTDKMDRIDSLLMELESGFKVSRAPETQSVTNKDLLGEFESIKDENQSATSSDKNSSDPSAPESIS